MIVSTDKHDHQQSKQYRSRDKRFYRELITRITVPTPVDLAFTDVYTHHYDRNRHVSRGALLILHLSEEPSNVEKDLLNALLLPEYHLTWSENPWEEGFARPI